MRKLTFVLAMLSTPVFAASADEATEKMWSAKCASCHGKDGKGKTKQGEKMKIADRNRSGSTGGTLLGSAAGDIRFMDRQHREIHPAPPSAWLIFPV